MNACEMLIMELSTRQNCRRNYNWPDPYCVCVFCCVCVICDLCSRYCDLLILCGRLQKICRRPDISWAKNLWQFGEIPPRRRISTVWGNPSTQKHLHQPDCSKRGNLSNEEIPPYRLLATRKLSNEGKTIPRMTC